LQAFLVRQDESAFGALLRRHGPMVLGVCRRVLCNEADAEDAFQATFLVLVRKASSVVPREAVGSWLHGVAYRTALHARAAASRRRAKERKMRRPEVRHDDPVRDLLPLLDQELGRLPDRYRLPLLLCDLEGRTRKEVARQLGWPEGSVAGRLARARALLARRLTRRGLVLSSGGLLAALADKAVAAVPGPLLVATARTAVAYAAGSTVGVVPTSVANLAQGVMKAMLLTRLKIVSALVLILVGLGLTASGLLPGTQAAPEPPAITGPGAESPPVESKSRPAQDQPSPKKSDDGQKEPGTWKLDSVPVPSDGEIYAAAFSPDGKLLATGSLSMNKGKGLQQVALIETATGKVIRFMDGPEGSVLAVAFSPDGKHVVSAGTDKTITFWDVATGAQFRKLHGHTDFVRALAFSPDARVLASGSYDRSVRLWPLTPAAGPVQHNAPHEGNVLAVAFSPDGRLLASAGADKQVLVWDVAGGKVLYTLKHEGSNSVGALGFSPDGRVLASGSADPGNQTRLFGKVRLWDVRTGKLLRKMGQNNGAVISLAFSPDGRSLVSGSAADGTVHLWDVASGQSQVLATEHKRSVRAAFSPDGRTLATWSADKTVKLWHRK
jgi:RNA polymerase sigma factor (sigma-70 family)